MLILIGGVSKSFPALHPAFAPAIFIMHDVLEVKDPQGAHYRWAGYSETFMRSITRTWRSSGVKLSTWIRQVRPASSVVRFGYTSIDV
jgi:hypothetical protein